MNFYSSDQFVSHTVTGQFGQVNSSNDEDYFWVRVMVGFLYIYFFRASAHQAATSGTLSFLNANLRWAKPQSLNVNANKKGLGLSS